MTTERTRPTPRPAGPTRLTRRRVSRQVGAGAGVLLLAACGSGRPEMAGGATSPAATVRSLTYWPWDQNRPDLAQVRDPILREFTAQYPQLSVSAVAAGGNFLEKLKAAVAAGTPPDVADTHQGRVRDLGAAGVVQDLTPLLKARPFPPEHLGWQPYRWRDRQFGVPWGLQATCVYYNRSLFEAAGVPVPGRDWTWEQFAELARRLTKPGAGEDDTIWGAADDGGRDYGWINALLAAFGGSALSPDFRQAALATPDSLAAIEFRAAWAGRLGITPPDGALGDQPERFFAGQLAMHCLGSWFVSNVKASQLGASDVWDVAPLPRGPRRRAGLAHENGIGLPAGIPSPEASWELVRYLTSPAGLTPFARAGRIVPANRTTWPAALPPDGRPARFKEAVLDVWEEIAAPSPWTPRRTEVTQIWQEELDPVWLGQRAPRDGAQAFDQRITVLLPDLVP
jgi:multiple sugar transport system substrate-binding protein